MARHRSPQRRRPSLPLLSPRVAAAGAGPVGRYGIGGPHVRHARPSTSPLRSPSMRIATAVAAVGGIAAAAHASTHGTPFPDAEEIGGWFGSAAGPADAVAVPSPRTPADAGRTSGASLAILGEPIGAGRSGAAALGVTGPAVAADRAGNALQRARDAARTAPTAPAAPTAAPSGGGIRIVSGRVTSGFGSRWGVQHQGLDIAAPIGTPIRVPMDGTVISSGPAGGFGLWVRVRHDDGTITVYGHINRALVRVGQKVVAGQEIAEVGNRGKTTGPHLHIEVVTPGGTKVDPKPWLDRHGFRYR